MFIAITKNKVAAVTWYIINTIYNVMKNICKNMFLIIITHINKTTTN